MTSIKDTLKFPYKTPSFTFYKSLLKFVERAHKLQPDADDYALVEAVVSMELISDRWAARHYVAFYLWDGVDPKDVLDHASNLAYSPEEQRVRAEQQMARAEARLYVPDPLPSPSPDRSEAEFDEEAERILSLLA